jgi:methylenetetrahydrofolate reductase (NADPH)
VNGDLLELLISQIELDSSMTYYVINKQGDLRTNTHSDGPNAVTWGVFPGKEIIQPTIVEAISFMAWKVSTSLLGSMSYSLVLIDYVLGRGIRTGL